MIKTAVLLIGHENGKRFIHCHGRWRETAGNDRIGHLLANQTHLAAPTTLLGWAIEGGSFDRVADAETSFELFKPVATHSTASANGLLLRIAPNEDLITTIENVCARYGIEHGTIHGLGSIVGAQFSDGRNMTSYATELMIDEGRIENGRASLDISIVGMDGNHMSGWLVPDKNAVCVTAELFILRQG
ncbi:PCC domain-containing protein [Qingshengfaniella alkalisoli]|nr:DUF296 domain-containing protein [Qingshengfaniella alkalisoli]